MQNAQERARQIRDWLQILPLATKVENTRIATRLGCNEPGTTISEPHTIAQRFLCCFQRWVGVLDLAIFVETSNRRLASSWSSGNQGWTNPHPCTSKANNLSTATRTKIALGAHKLSTKSYLTQRRCKYFIYWASNLTHAINHAGHRIVTRAGLKLGCKSIHLRVMSGSH